MQVMPPAGIVEIFPLFDPLQGFKEQIRYTNFSGRYFQYRLGMC